MPPTTLRGAAAGPAAAPPDPRGAHRGRCHSLWCRASVAHGDGSKKAKARLPASACGRAAPDNITRNAAATSGKAAGARQAAHGGDVDRLRARAKVATAPPQGVPPAAPALENIVQQAPQLHQGRTEGVDALINGADERAVKHEPCVAEPNDGRRQRWHGQTANTAAAMRFTHQGCALPDRPPQHLAKRYGTHRRGVRPPRDAEQAPQGLRRLPQCAQQYAAHSLAHGRHARRRRIRRARVRPTATRAASSVAALPPGPQPGGPQGAAHHEPAPPAVRRPSQRRPAQP